ncbi:BF3164 family lipoprotein [Gracilimonas sp.]|uniref:BF3164 family lipoprotein n=1 Tax=Gracilimonas sp. TaxID=1974203 RepID=UPI00287189CC|nr:BF3164 family lipoprotein [Gracilimonas sp.]
MNNDVEPLKYSKYATYILPPQLMLSQNAAFINDTTIISSGGLTKGLVAFTNTNSDKSEYINPLKYDLEELNEKEKGYLFESVVAVNADKKLIAIAPRFVPELFIINFDGELISSYALPENFDLNQFDDIANKKGIFYGVAATDEYIYVAHVGKTLNEMSAIIEEEDYNDVNFTNLYLFDWEGEFIESYQLLGGSYRSIYVDEVNNRVFSLDLLTSSIVYIELE